jgi:hypothetical protein
VATITIQFSTASPVEWFDRWVLDRSKMICRLSHSPFSHGDLVLHDGHLLGASDNPNAPILRSHPPGNPRGVAIRPANYQKFAIRRRAVIPVTLRQKRHYEEFCRAQLGKPFDHEALRFKTFLSAELGNRDWRNPDLWYCHEMLVRGYEVVGILPWKLINVKNRVTSGDHLLIINPLIDVEAFYASDL